MQYGESGAINTVTDLKTSRTLAHPTEQGLVKVKEVNGVRQSNNESTIPRLPSIPTSRPSAAGLRKLQAHLAQVQGDGSPLEVVEEEEIS